MKNTVILLFLISLATFSNAQTKGLDQVDSSGKRTGEWIVYLNKYWKTVRDSNKAAFSRYSYYEKGIDIQVMGRCGKRWLIECDGKSLQKKAGVTQLNGEYKWTDRKGKIRCLASFKNGECLSFKWFYPSGEIQSVWDYTKQYKEQPHSYWFAEYDKKGNAKEYYFRKASQNASGWYCFPAANN